MRRKLIRTSLAALLVAMVLPTVAHAQRGLRRLGGGGGGRRAQAAAAPAPAPKPKKKAIKSMARGSGLPKVTLPNGTVPAGGGRRGRRAAINSGTPGGALVIRQPHAPAPRVDVRDEMGPTMKAPKTQISGSDVKRPRHAAGKGKKNGD